MACRFLLILVVSLLVWITNGPDSIAQDVNSRLDSKLKSESPGQLADDATRFGNPVRGAIAFHKTTMACALCHQANAGGRQLGPDLTAKREVTVDHLIQSLLEPSAQIKQGYESIAVQTEDGQLIVGILVKEKADSLVVDVVGPDQPLTIDKETIDDWKRTTTSTMPSGLVNQLSDRGEFLDLVSYLAEIAKYGPTRAAELQPAIAALPPLPEYESRIDHAGLIGALNEDSFERGAETFRLRCASCHGTIKEEGSMPTSLRFADGVFKNGNAPHQMYQTLTHGYGMMNPQRWMVPQQKYEVIHYIREHFLKPKNGQQWFEISEEYLAGLPKGDARGPKPIVSRPWTLMDYGPSLNNTIEVSSDGSNIAQKGIAIRLDDGPGGVESGSHWLMYEHDTMRVAAAWTGRFIDYEGIHFNGAHGRHPKVAGEIQFANPTGPGFGRPAEGPLADMGNVTFGLFDDDRVIGRDEKHYGPLPVEWARFLGLYRFGKKTILKYRVDSTEILETPGLQFIDEHPVYTRTLNIGPREKDIVVQIAKVEGESHSVQSGPANAAIILPARSNKEPDPDAEQANGTLAKQGIEFGGAELAEITDGDRFDMTEKDYSIYARIKTSEDGGTIWAQTKKQDDWIPQGKTLFLCDGRPTFDIGWVGVVNSRRKVNDGKWHDIVMTWRAESEQVKFYVDGRPAGGGELAAEKRIDNQVVRIGFTNRDFPDQPFFEGNIKEVRFYQRALSRAEIKTPAKISDKSLIGSWNLRRGNTLVEAFGKKELDAIVTGEPKAQKPKLGLIAGVSLDSVKWFSGDGDLRLLIPQGPAVNLVVSHCAVESIEVARRIEKQLPKIQTPRDLQPLTEGGPANYPERLTTRMIRGDDDGPFAVDVLERPKNNPWNAQLRLTGLDFLPGGKVAIVSAWDGSVWRVTGFDGGGNVDELSWQRIAVGLFQPLGVKYQNEKIYITCRDQIVILHDLNGDFETDWYENFNSDHQVTEHFHEFAMGLQTDDAGNFYYAKSARHAKKAVVPHHGTLLKVSADGKTTEILADGFRAANGVCLNPDGSFVVTDQEGHWNPKNRINWVRPGGFYGNMFGYHDVTDDSDDAMDQPLCWITNAFDRSPSELMWVDSPKWGKLNGSLLNFSYGYGKVYVVPHEEIDGQMQGGMCEFPLEQFPTGVMRGRFNDADGQLYCCGMFAWAGSQHQPGGLYRIRRTDKPVHLPIGLRATSDGVVIQLSDAVDVESATNAKNWAVKIWDLKRTAKYGSDHYNERQLEVSNVEVMGDGAAIRLTLPELKPTWGMEIVYSLKTSEGGKLQGKIHNTIHKMGK